MSSRMRDIDRRKLSRGAKLTSSKKRQGRNDDEEENYQANNWREGRGNCY